MDDSKPALRQGPMAALIAARPGPLRDGLRALLGIIPQIDLVEQAGDVQAVMEAFEEECPALILLDADLPGYGASTVTTIKGRCAPALCLVLADTARQQEEARSAGADVVLLKGFPAARLLRILEEFSLQRNSPSLPDQEAGEGTCR